MVKKPGQNGEEEEDPLEAIIWRVMGNAARKSQRMVERCGVTFCMKAIRTECASSSTHHCRRINRRRPLDKHVQPWQQIWMDFGADQEGTRLAQPGTLIQPTARRGI